MNPKTISSVELETLDIEEELTDFTADLLALKANEVFLERLFAKPVGQWSDLAGFFDKNEQIYHKLTSLQANCEGTLRVTWLEHPELVKGYCLVLFYVDSLEWNNLALYNKARLERLHATGN